MLVDQVKLAISVLTPGELQELKVWLGNPELMGTEPINTNRDTTSPVKTFLDNTAYQRQVVLEQLSTAEDYLALIVQARDKSGKQPIAMHISKLNKIGPALLTMIIEDHDFCEALGEMVDEARRRRLGIPPNQLFP